MKNHYGHFSTDGKEYVITRPDTPRPWVNILSNDNYRLVISQVCGGESVYLCPGANRATTYLPASDMPGRYVYIRDEDTGDFFVPSIYPVNRGSRFQCRHGLGYSIWSSEYRGIRATLACHVTMDAPVESWSLQLENRSSRNKRLKIFPFVEWCFTGGDWEAGLNKTAGRAASGNFLFAKRFTPGNTGFKHMGFLAPDFKITEFDCSRRIFLGRMGGYHAPEAVIAGKCLNSAAEYEELVTVAARSIELSAGATFEMSYLIGVAEKTKEIQTYIRKYLAKGAHEKEAVAIKSFWQKRNDAIVITTPLKELDTTVNAWLKAQITQCARWTRGGKRGYRDVLQDSSGVVLFDSARAREMLIEALNHQYANGFALRQWTRAPGWDTLDARDYRDSPFWIIYALTSYLKETGDMAFLDTEVDFLHKADRSSVWDHAIRAVTFLANDRGRHGLSHIGRGDWNDSMNEVGTGGKGESVWLSMALFWALNEMAELAKRKKEIRRERTFLNWAEEIRKAVENSAWDGRWYLAAYDDNGRPIGSSCDQEGRLHLNSQCWSAFSNIGTPQHVAAAFRSIDKYLNSPWGVRLLYPRYVTYDPHIGRLTTDCTENGTVYVHAAVFKVVGDCVLGRGDQAFETLKKILPSTGDPEEKWAEPYVFPNFYMDDYPTQNGHSKMGWYTGTAAWAIQAVVEWMLGARKDYDGLLIDPCLPLSWKSCRVERSFRGCRYNINIHRKTKNRKGVWSISLDGQQIHGNILPHCSCGRVHQAEVVI